MKFRILLITAVLASFVHGAIFAQTESADIEYNELFKQAYTYFLTSNYVSAIPLFNSMQKLKPEELIPVEYLGISYTNLPEERPKFTNALFWLVEAEKRGSSKTSVYCSLACIYSLEGDIKKAESAMNKALALGYDDFEWISRNDDLVNFRTGSWWKGIAKNYTQIEQQLALFNEFSEIEEEKSITERITFYNGIVTALKKLAPNIPALQCEPLSSLVSSYNDMENYALAEQNALKAKDIYEKTLGKEHRSYAASLDNLGFLYCNMGDYVKAERCFLETRTIREKTLGKKQ